MDNEFDSQSELGCKQIQGTSPQGTFPDIGKQDNAVCQVSCLLYTSVETYPLNQSQISIFTEEVLKLAMSKGQITAWDLYNVATDVYKRQVSGRGL